MSLVAVLTDPASGGTFLTWTIHYLAGHTQHFNYRTNSWHPLIENPVDKVNSHKFKANQVGEYYELSECMDNLHNCHTENFHTIYFHNLVEIPYSNEYKDTRKAADLVTSISDKIILLTNQSKNSAYRRSARYRVLSKKSYMDPSVPNTSNSQKLEDFIRYFFKDSINTWDVLQSGSVWDQREFIALVNYEAHVSIEPYVDLSIDHFAIDCLQWFTTGESLIPSLFDYLEVKVDDTRLDAWTNVYQKWRKIHYNRLNFLWYFDKIIHYILWLDEYE
jgi:hypothetical protein